MAMTRREAMRQTHQENTLLELGFTREEAESLRRISMRLQHWYEKECGLDNGCIERDDETGKPFWLNSISMRRFPIADLEAGAVKRLERILEQRNSRIVTASPVRKLNYYLQTDPRGAALYLLRLGDVPDGCEAQSYYTRGICVY